MNRTTPQYKHRNASEINREVDHFGHVSYWAILKTGLVIDGCTTVGEETLNALYRRLRDAKTGRPQ